MARAPRAPVDARDWLSSTKNLGRRPQNRAIKRKGTDPKTGLLNVKRRMGCLLLWVARFPSCLVLALACCSCVVCGLLLGLFALFLVLCALWATTREPILSSRFDEEDALLNRYLSTPVCVCEIRCHLQGTRVIGCVYVCGRHPEVVHIDAFILEFLALPSFLFVQSGCHCGYHVSVRHLCSFKRQPQRHHFGSREDEHRGCGDRPI